MKILYSASLKDDWQSVSFPAVDYHPLHSTMSRNPTRPDLILILGIVLCAGMAALWLLAPRILQHLH